jgi:hypothetical protein
MLRASVCMVVALVTADALADVPCAAPASPYSCAAPAPGCAVPAPPCDRCRPPVCAPPPAEGVQAAAGMFVTPPPSGTVVGAAQSVGVQGMELTFPETRLRLPSLSLPAFFRSRSNARMVLDAGHAPLVQGQAAAMTAAMPLAVSPGVAMLGAGAMGAAVASPGAMQAAGSPGGAALQGQSCAASAGLDDKLRQIEAAEERVQQKIEQLQRCLQQLQTSQHVPPQEAPRLAPAGFQGTLEPRWQQSAIPEPRAQFAERPAAYFGEPLRLAEPRQWITEPQAASGRITGFRPAAH